MVVNLSPWSSYSSGAASGLGNYTQWHDTGVSGRWDRGSQYADWKQGAYYEVSHDRSSSGEINVARRSYSPTYANVAIKHTGGYGSSQRPYTGSQMSRSYDVIKQGSPGALTLGYSPREKLNSWDGPYLTGRANMAGVVNRREAGGNDYPYNVSDSTAYGRAYRRGDINASQFFTRQTADYVRNDRDELDRGPEGLHDAPRVSVRFGRSGGSYGWAGGGQSFRF